MKRAHGKRHGNRRKARNKKLKRKEKRHRDVSTCTQKCTNGRLRACAYPLKPPSRSENYAKKGPL